MSGKLLEHRARHIQPLDRDGRNAECWDAILEGNLKLMREFGRMYAA